MFVLWREICPCESIECSLLMIEHNENRIEKIFYVSLVH